MRRGAVAIALVLTACAAADLLPPGTPHDATAVIRPASVVADRETAAPGETVTLDFPDEDIVGVGYALEQEVGSTWVYRYLLNTPGEVGEPGWQEADENLVIPALGIADPVRVVIPDVATPGTWRICTMGSAENVCVRIEIVDG